MGRLNITTNIPDGKVTSHDRLIDIQCVRTAAEQGNVDAQFILGECYSKGEGVKQDYEQAAYWYRKAAEQGVTAPQGNLAPLKERRDQGDAVTQYNPGRMYQNGFDVKKDNELNRCQKAAEQGDAHAQLVLELLKGFTQK